MRITRIQIFNFEKENSRIKAFVNVTFDKAFVIHGIKIVEGKKGPFVSMPTRKNKEGKHLEIAHPINKKFKSILVKLILNEYNKRQAKETKQEDTQETKQEDKQ